MSFFGLAACVAVQAIIDLLRGSEPESSSVGIGEGKTRREARRAHKRHLANRVIRRMWNDESRRHNLPLRIAA